MPQCHTKPHLASNSPPRKATFSILTLLLPSLSPLLLKLGEVIANIAMIFMALFLSWLACTQLPPLAKIQKATNNSLATATLSGDQWADFEIYYRIFYDLQVEISERSKALAEVEKIAREQGKEAMEREREMEQRLKRLEKERDDAFKERVRDKEDFERLEKQMKEEAERLEQEGNRRTKVWEEKAKRWEEKKAEERKSSLESRERDRESWKGC